ncbi:helix-turn-helix domain-containing protein [Vibrio breoganii]
MEHIQKHLKSGVNSRKNTSTLSITHLMRTTMTKPAQRKLLHREKVRMVRLYERGYTQKAIAQKLGRGVATVGRVISTYKKRATLPERHIINEQ